MRLGPPWPPRDWQSRVPQFSLYLPQWHQSDPWSPALAGKTCWAASRPARWIRPSQHPRRHLLQKALLCPTQDPNNNHNNAKVSAAASSGKLRRRKKERKGESYLGQVCQSVTHLSVSLWLLQHQIKKASRTFQALTSHLIQRQKKLPSAQRKKASRNFQAFQQNSQFWTGPLKAEQAGKGSLQLNEEEESESISRKGRRVMSFYYFSNWFAFELLAANPIGGGNERWRDQICDCNCGDEMIVIRREDEEEEARRKTNISWKTKNERKKLKK